MTAFIGNLFSLGPAGNNLNCSNDDRLSLYCWSRFSWNQIPDYIWPRSQYRGSEGPVTTAPLNNAPLIWDWSTWVSVDAAQGQRRNSIVGITRYRSNGVAVGGCTVKCYRTLTDEVVDTVTSDANGNYTVTSPYGNEATYVRAHLSGSPDIDGVTAQTLAPS